MSLCFCFSYVLFFVLYFSSSLRTQRQCPLFQTENFDLFSCQVGEPGHREVAEEGEEALRRLEHAVSVVLFWF